MKLLRVALTIVVALATFYFTFWIGGGLLFMLGLPPWFGLILGLLCAVAAARFSWVHSQDLYPDLFTTVVLGALAAGAIGFSVGFFGPLALTPDSPQGPLTGILITGPLGLLLGAIGGGVYWLVHGRRAAPPTPHNGAG
jgi:hypothetical protein